MKKKTEQNRTERNGTAQHSTKENTQDQSEGILEAIQSESIILNQYS